MVDDIPSLPLLVCNELNYGYDSFEEIRFTRHLELS